MKVARVVPPRQPVFTLTFSRDEGWAVLMALKDAYAKYPDAADRQEWKLWAAELEGELRRDS